MVWRQWNCMWKSMKKQWDLTVDYQSWVFLHMELFILISLLSSKIKGSLGSNPGAQRWGVSCSMCHAPSAPRKALSELSESSCSIPAASSEQHRELRDSRKASSSQGTLSGKPLVRKYLFLDSVHELKFIKSLCLCCIILKTSELSELSATFQ